MKKDKLKLLIFEGVTISIFLGIVVSRAFFGKRWALVGVLGALCLVYLVFLRTKRIPNGRETKVLKTMVLLGGLYVLVEYTAGVYSGFYRSLHLFGVRTLFEFLVPTCLIIVFVEFLREKFLSVEGRLSLCSSFLFGVIVDLILFANIYDMKSLDDFLYLVGYIAFASFASNLFYVYLSKRFGMKPVVAYRLLTTVYIYLIPVIPDIHMLFVSFFRMVFPLLGYVVIESFYGEVEDSRELRRNRFDFVFDGILLTFAVLFIAVISCQFRFGALVVGSSSMKGSLNKGDVVIYDSKRVEPNEGDTIVFLKDGVKTVHRVVSVSYRNDERQYFTKGDANLQNDDGFRVDDDIIGEVSFKIPFVGRPTLLLHEAFNSSLGRAEGVEG